MFMRGEILKLNYNSPEGAYRWIPLQLCQITTFGAVPLKLKKEKYHGNSFMWHIPKRKCGCLT